MRLVPLILLIASQLSGAITVVSHQKAVGITSTTTTAAISCTTSTAIVLATQSTLAPSGVSDSSSNTWTAGISHDDGASDVVKFWYVVNPTVTGSQTFTLSVIGGGSIEVICLAGTATSSLADQQNSNDSGSLFVTTQTTGSVTPANANEIVIAAICLNPLNSGTLSIGGGFTISDSTVPQASASMGGMAYLIQTTATAANPTFTFSSNTASAAIMSFNAAGAAAAVINHRILSSH